MRKRIPQRLIAWAACFVIPMASGCQPGEAPDRTGSTSPGGDEPAVVEGPDSAEEIPLAIASWEETQAMVRQHRGKIVVVDLWTTW
jgi:hypothetical protein